MSEAPSMSLLFAVSFLGALFAILVCLLIVYTYVTLRLMPRAKQALRDFVGEIGPRAVFEQANLDPVEAMRHLGISPGEAAAAIEQHAGVAMESQVVFTCEDHGRCVGCPRVLAQFEAIIVHQGEETFDAVERKCYEQLREQLSGDARLDEEKVA